jgi:peroxiredoxin
MSQSEIAGGKMTPAGALPSKGLRIPDLRLTDTDGRFVQASDYRGRRSLVLIFADSRNMSSALLSEVGEEYQAFVDEDAEVLAIVWASPEEAVRFKRSLKLTFPVLNDEDGVEHRNFGAIDGHGRAAAAVYVTDRFGEIYDALRTRDGDRLPTASEILASLEFISIQCPECAPPEWPV